MRRNTSAKSVEWSARVSSQEKNEFKNLLPFHGAQTACLNIALEKFLDQVENNPALLEFVHEDIQRHIHEEVRGAGKDDINITIPTNLYLRFNEVVPEHGGTSWFIRRTIKALNRQLAEFVLDERIELAVRSILRGEVETDGTE